MPDWPLPLLFPSGAGSSDDVARRTAVNQAPGGGSEYPFTGPGGLVGTVLDFYLSYADQRRAHPLPFAVEFAGGTATVTDAAGGVVAAAPVAAAVTRAWGSRTVYEWTGAAYVMRAVTWGEPSGSGVLDPRTCDRLPARVAAVRVGLDRLVGDVKLVAGYNVALAGVPADAPADGGRYVTAVTLDAVPGAGAGRVTGCADAAPVVRRINQVGPDCAGNFVVEVDGCFRAGPPLVVTGGVGESRTAEFVGADGANTLRLASDCHACCECDYYVRTYRGLKRMWTRWQAAAGHLEDVRDTYEANRTRWLLSRQCRIDNPAQLHLTTDTSCKTLIGASFCNVTSCCLTPVELRFTFRRYSRGQLISPFPRLRVDEAYKSGSDTDGEERYAPDVRGNGQVVRFLYDFADPQATSVAKLKSCSPGCTPDQTLEVTLTVHAPSPPPNPHNGDPCTLATPTVPAWLQAAWNAAGVAGDPVRVIITKLSALNPARAVYPCEC